MSSRNAGAVLELLVGVRARATVPLMAIAGASVGEWSVAQSGEGLATVNGSANVKLSLTHPVALTRVLRRPERVTVLLLQVDDPHRLVQAVTNAAVVGRAER